MSLFATARANAPSIIFCDELDALCPKREDSTDDMQKRLVAALLTLMDGLVSNGEGVASSTGADRVLVIGATNRPDALDTALRRAGRFDREIEIGIPNEPKRKDILKRMLKNMPNSITEEEVRARARQTHTHSHTERVENEDIDFLMYLRYVCPPPSHSMLHDCRCCVSLPLQLSYVSSVSHGFVGADLKALCRESALIALDRWQSNDSNWIETLKHDPNGLQLIGQDMMAALANVKPSAMRSVIIDVPKVAWNDIGGQEDVKQKLKEAVEWPLMVQQQKRNTSMRTTPANIQSESINFHSPF